MGRNLRAQQARTWRAEVFRGLLPRVPRCLAKNVATASPRTSYVFKPQLAGMVLYVKLVLRSDCVVISFHEDEGEGHEEDA